MVIPKNIMPGDTIGICAPSSGVVEPLKIKRLDSAIRNFNKLGYKIKESSSVRKDDSGQSNTPQIRAKEFMDLYLSDNISAIIAAAGGDFLVEILPYIDFESLKKSPKFVQGFSDVTALIFCITTICDIATIYGPNFGSFGMTPMYKDLQNSIKFLEGKDLIQTSFQKYQDGYTKLENNPSFEYDLNKNVNLINLTGQDIVDIQGRLIGGCLDVLLNIVGTRFDNVKTYIEKYKKDGFIWYLESCELTGEQIRRGLFELKESGWFKYVKGFVFGRYGIYSSVYNLDYYQIIKSCLNELNVPIIVDADIGHKPPQLTVINGLNAKIISKNSKAILYYL